MPHNIGLLQEILNCELGQLFMRFFLFLLFSYVRFCWCWRWGEKKKPGVQPSSSAQENMIIYQWILMYLDITLFSKSLASGEETHNCVVILVGLWATSE